MAKEEELCNKLAKGSYLGIAFFSVIAFGYCLFFSHLAEGMLFLGMFFGLLSGRNLEVDDFFIDEAGINPYFWQATTGLKLSLVFLMATLYSFENLRSFGFQAFFGMIGGFLFSPFFIRWPWELIVSLLKEKE